MKKKQKKIVFEYLKFIGLFRSRSIFYKVLEDIQKKITRA